MSAISPRSVKCLLERGADLNDVFCIFPRRQQLQGCDPQRPSEAEGSADVKEALGTYTHESGLVQLSLATQASFTAAPARLCKRSIAILRLEKLVHGKRRAPRLRNHHLPPKCRPSSTGAPLSWSV